MQLLIAGIESGNTDFNLVLVYNVSRWGRFQDADESAYYEHFSKRKGIAVAYVAEQCCLIKMGFRQGVPAGFGLRRVLIDQSGQVKGELRRGEHKSLQTDRVILIPGPDSEVATVNQIYHWLVERDLPLTEIVKRLNNQPVFTD